MNKKERQEAMKIAEAFRKARRFGPDKDSPEGVRYIKVSDTLANQLADTIEDMANGN